MTIDMSQFFQEFFEEAEELLAEKERLLLGIDIASPQKEEIDAVFRAAHSIKGGAATFGFSDITEVTHVMESLLDRIRKGEMALTSEHVDVFLQAKDILAMLVEGHRHGAEVDREAVKVLQEKLERLSANAGSAPVKAATAPKPAVPARVATQPGEHCFRIALPAVAEKDVEALMAELALMGSITREAGEGGTTVFVLTTRESQDDILAVCSFVLDPAALKITEEVAAPDLGIAEEGPGYGLFLPLDTPVGTTGASAATASSVKEGAAEHKTAKSPAAKPAASQQESASIRVGIEKVDQLINMVGELVITQAMIEQRVGSLDPMLHERLLTSVAQLARNTRDLQEAVMSIRMMPMDYAFSRYPRMVRDLAGKLGKKVDFVTHGGATELDKGLIERIIDPLTHLVRNSVDHGIELPAARIAAGKPEAGRLSLSAAHQGGNIIIEVTDDGGGLNRERILNKAKQQGLPVSDNMPDQDVWRLIFAPGFSTAEQVTDISGRGVGMDVVRRNITALGGSIDIRSVTGYGTTMSISLPLTLAILDGMSIKVGEEIYILPLGYVVESLQPQPDDIKEVAGEGRLIKVRGEYLPLVPLYQVFGIEPRQIDPSRGIVVIVEADGRKAALIIDELVGQQQVVVKNLEANYRRVAGISGATILGDGGVALILDVPALSKAARLRESQSVFS
jgi:two-component system chemotaxis sensor kinase CheA